MDNPYEESSNLSRREERGRRECKEKYWYVYFKYFIVRLEGFD